MVVLAQPATGTASRHAATRGMVQRARIGGFPLPDVEPMTMPGLRASQPSGLRSFRGVEQSLLRGGMQERDHRIPRGGQDPHEGRGSDDLRGPAARACPRFLVARRRPPERPAADHDVRGAVEQDERAVGELVEGELVQSPGPAVQALGVQARVDGVVACSGILGELPLRRPGRRQPPRRPVGAPSSSEYEQLLAPSRSPARRPVRA